MTAVSKATGFPEILDGRVKTLHPKIHAGILARRDAPEHVAALAKHGIAPIDVVVREPLPVRGQGREGRTFDEAVENIDIGGPTHGARRGQELPRTWRWWWTRPTTALLLEQLDRERRHRRARRASYFAQKAFRHTGALRGGDRRLLRPGRGARGGYVPAEADETFPYRLSLTFEKVQDLRYGENPHQRAAFYSDLGSTLYSRGRGRASCRARSSRSTTSSTSTPPGGWSPSSTSRPA